MTENQSKLYQFGFIQTQPGYYETPLNKELFLIAEEGEENYTLYSGKQDAEGNLEVVKTGKVSELTM